MSEPVYHTLSIAGTNAVDAATATYKKIDQLERQWDLTQSGTHLSFTTPWEPQLICVLDISRDFPECRFDLSFYGSMGTELEDTTKFSIKNGSIEKCVPYMQDNEDARKVVTGVLNYCGVYADVPVSLRKATENMLVIPRVMLQPFKY